MTINPVEWITERKDRLRELVSRSWGYDEADIVRGIIESYITTAPQIGRLHATIRELMERLAKHEQPQQYDQVEQWPKFTGD
jgi:hypothetical protein